MVYSCTGRTEPAELEVDQDPKAEALQEIESLEAILFKVQTEVLDTLAAAKTINAYRDYARMYPRDEHTPDFLFKAGDLSRGIGDLWEATKLFNMVSTSYSYHELAPRALFIQGLCFQELGQEEYARYSFEDVISKYPDNELVDDAGAMLQMLELGEEEYFDTNINDQ
jgi:TolA-binding protein